MGFGCVVLSDCALRSLGVADMATEVVWCDMPLRCLPSHGGFPGAIVGTMTPCHVLWLCCRYNPQQRVHVSGAGRFRSHTWDLQSDARRQQEQRLPGFPWHSDGWHLLQDSLAMAGESAQQLDADGDLAGRVVAVALVSRHAPFTGPLHRLSSEQSFLHHLCGCCDGVFVRVLEYATLVAPMLCSHYSAEYSPHCTCFRLASGFLSMLAEQRCSNFPDLTFGQVIASWTHQHRLPRRDFDSCLQVWAPQAWAISRGFWRSLFIPCYARVEQSCSYYWQLHEDGRVVARASSAGGPQPDPPPLCSSRLRSIANHLRDLAAFSLDGVDIPDRDEEREALISDIRFLESQAASLDVISRSSMEGFGRFGSQSRFKLHFLLEVFLMSTSLRQQADLRAVLCMSIRSLLPSHVGDFFWRRFERNAYRLKPHFRASRSCWTWRTCCVCG